MSEPAATLRGIHKSYQTAEATVHALQGIDLDLQPGSFTAIMGASGSGKSTLLNVLSGLSAPDQGDIYIEGKALASMDDTAQTIFRRKRMGIIFQAYNLVPVLTAAENVGLPLILDGVSQAEAIDKARPLLERVGLGQRAEHRPDALSGGEQQRVAIARALINEPALILGDEPTGNLDSTTTAAICQLFKELHAEQGKTLALITHEADVACHAERVVVLADGRIAGELQGDDLKDAAQLAARYQELLAAGAAA